MHEIEGNLWDHTQTPNMIFGILTNGTVKRDGTLVMGAGIAGQAKHRYPDLARHFGKDITRFGLCVRLTSICDDVREIHIPFFNFPTKFNWQEKSSVALIKRSARELQTVVSNNMNYKFMMPRPGCGLGGLNWETDVRPIMRQYFLNEDRLYIIHNPRRVVK